jgi:hypothetical protein
MRIPDSEEMVQMKNQLEQSGSESFYRRMFVVAALYDAMLGVLFFAMHAPIYEFFAIPVPENVTYLRMISAFVFVQGVGYWYVSRAMLRNVDLVKLGAIYKALYILVSCGESCRTRSSPGSPWAMRSS